jgi:hypothetical protein
MKTKLQLFIFCAILAFSAKYSNAQALIQYWDFNQTVPAGGGGGDSLGNVTNALTANQVATGLTAGHIIYSRPTHMYNATTLDGILDNGTQGSVIYDHSNSNDTTGTAAGNYFVRTRNPSDSCVMLFYIPTTGFKNIKFDFALSASSTRGPNYGIFAYSIDGGTRWKNLTSAMDTFNISGVKHPDTLQLQNPTTAASAWYAVQMDFSTDDTVNNNANFIISLRLAGPNSYQQTSGNARFDNFSVWGNSLTTAGINELPAQAAGYNVYPNPANDVLTITSTHEGVKVLSVSNILGQQMNVTRISGKQSSVNISELTSGVYFLSINELATGSNYTVKFVKN